MSITTAPTSAKVIADAANAAENTTVSKQNISSSPASSWV